MRNDAVLGQDVVDRQAGAARSQSGRRNEEPGGAHPLDNPKPALAGQVDARSQLQGTALKSPATMPDPRRPASCRETRACARGVVLNGQGQPRCRAATFTGSPERSTRAMASAPRSWQSGLASCLERSPRTGWPPRRWARGRWTDDCCRGRHVRWPPAARATGPTPRVRARMSGRVRPISESTFSGSGWLWAQIEVEDPVDRAVARRRQGRQPLVGGASNATPSPGQHDDRSGNHEQGDAERQMAQPKQESCGDGSRHRQMHAEMGKGIERRGGCRCPRKPARSVPAMPRAIRPPRTRAARPSVQRATPQDFAPGGVAPAITGTPSPKSF